MSLDINLIPHRVLGRLNAHQAVLRTDAHLGNQVLISTSLDPRDVSLYDDLGVFSGCRQQEGVFSITMTVIKLAQDFIEESTSHFENRYRIISELDTVLQYNRDVYVVYVITHYNPGQRPYGPLTVNIGGDCHRTGHHIKDLQSILTRTRDLAEAMLKKAVMIFPDIPALHGGKKGEWIILDRKGEKIEGLSEEAIIALGSAIIPKGISFLNRYKEQQAQEMGIFDSFPKQDYVLPDSGSPDVLSGIYWRGERKDKYINMCDAWNRRGVNMRQFTCLPANLGGTKDSSARPTGYGVSTTTAELAQRYFALRGRSLESLSFLLEAAGGVGRNTVESLINKYGVPPHQITVFDRNDAASKLVAEKYRVNAITLRHEDLYHTWLPEEIRRGTRFDVWVNNGEGDNTRPEHVANLLQAGVRVFTGGANNYLKVSTQKESRQLIFDAGGWAWPDPATSGGGWTLAVIDIMTRCQQQRSDTDEIQERILDIITTRNRRLVDDVLNHHPTTDSGAEIWQRVDRLIAERVERTLSLDLTPQQIFEGANTTRWHLT